MKQLRIYICETEEQIQDKISDPSDNGEIIVDFTSGSMVLYAYWYDSVGMWQYFDDADNDNLKDSLESICLMGSNIGNLI